MRLEDARTYRQRTEQARRRLAEHGAADGVREEILCSWERSATHLAGERHAAPLAAEDRAHEQWQASPVRRALPSLREELDRVVADGGFIAAITGTDGTIQWTHGTSAMQDRAAAVHFVTGGRWDEASMGTNALGLALLANRACEVFSAEHFSAAVHDWVCYSAPIREPSSGRVLGVLDLSTTWEQAQPLGLHLATLLARSLSLALPEDAARSASGGGLELQVLGPPRVRLDGRELALPRRQLELLTVLSLHPDGLGLGAMHAALHPDHTVQPATVKSEVSHLRRALGAPVIASRPYRLTVPVRADHLDVVDALAAGRVDAALDRYAGPLLPGTESPALRQHAHYLEAAVRRAVFTAGDPALLVVLSERFVDDVEVHERALAVLADDDPRAAIVHGRLEAALA